MNAASKSGDLMISEEAELKDGSNAVAPVSVVIPTYRREDVLIQTVRFLLDLNPRPSEILVVDQTEQHTPEVAKTLEDWNAGGRIRWTKLPRPSITHAMNVGLVRARQEIVLFLDDDIIPGARLLAAHARVHLDGTAEIVAGQVLQPGEAAEDHPWQIGGEFRFNSNQRGWIRELMGGNFSVDRKLAMSLGGFDENFVHVAYRFEAEFCDRALSGGKRILFLPEASIRHLKASAGGTRSFGSHLTTIRPSHAVGAYYYLLQARSVRSRCSQIAGRMWRSIRTKHHLLHPWWVPGTLIAELLGLIWALRLSSQGARLIGDLENE